MEQISIYVLLFITSILGVSKPLGQVLPQWTVSKEWVQSGEFYQFDATSNAVVDECKNNPEKKILFPRIVHSAHKFYLDGRLVSTVGDPTFRIASPFYAQPLLECAQLADGKELRWEAFSYSRYFSRVQAQPEIVSHSKANILNSTANAVAAGSLILISLYSLLIFWSRVPNKLSLSVGFGGLFAALYLINCANSDLGVTTSMLISHKLADFGLWSGGFLVTYALYQEGIVSKLPFRLFTVTAVIAALIILAGESGDEIQLGTILPMLPIGMCSISGLRNIIRDIAKNGFAYDKTSRLFGIVIFFVLSLNDILSILGLVQTPMLVCFGLVGYVFGISIAVNREIEKTYIERDALLVGLENKVAEKTQHLLEALQSLKSTQAELIHSSRLASLGTLSAGIAHEINNAINYVNGALRPLEKIVLESVSAEKLPKVKKLLAAIKEGTSLTVEIVKSLRNYTGLNHAKYKDVQISVVLNSILTILRSKIASVDVDFKIDPDLTVFGSQVGLSQVFMNIVSNAIDSLPGIGGRLNICGQRDGEFIRVDVIDNGSGIPIEIQSRIFDPFFTTKDVGKGTGLGLHIVQGEVNRHNGKISLKSSPGLGTTFSIWIPVHSNLADIQGEAA